MAGHPVRRCRRWCRCWGGRERRLPAPRVGSVRAPGCRGQTPPEETSKQRGGPAGYLRPCTRYPYRRRRASQGCGSAKWYGRGVIGNPAFGAHLRSWSEASQRTELNRTHVDSWEEELAPEPKPDKCEILSKLDRK